MVWIYLSIIISIVLFSILNRLRGTGLIKEFGVLTVFKWKIPIKLVWNHVYAVYIGLLVFLLADYNIVAGLFAFVAYIVGESKGWGEWVGALTSSDKEHTYYWLRKQYDDNEGKKFPYVHYIANLFVKEQTVDNMDLDKRVAQYLTYARVALSIRGMVWWLPIYSVMGYFEILDWGFVIAATILNGVLFPIACNIGKYLNTSGKLGVINFSPGWENQELLYGFYTGIIFWTSVLLCKINI